MSVTVANTQTYIEFLKLNLQQKTKFWFNEDSEIYIVTLTYFAK